MKTTEREIIFDFKKQKAILESYNNDQLFESLKRNFTSIDEKIFCKVRTEKSIKKLIFITLDIFRSRNIFLHTVYNNSWTRISHFNFDFKERLIRLYDKIEDEMQFTKIGIY